MMGNRPCHRPFGCPSGRPLDRPLSRPLTALVVSVTLVALSGANCPNMVHQFGAPRPRVLQPGATIEQVLNVVNANNGRIQSLSSTDASISVPGSPTLRANLAFCRPGLLRLRAKTALTGPELDLGSNEELFWFWVRRAEPPAVFYCRHADYPDSAAQRMIPIDPAWLGDVLGAATLDPALPHQGPYAMPGDRLQVRTVVETVQGPMTRITVVDAIGGAIVEQHVYDTAGGRVASAVVEQHRRDPLTNLVVPRVVKIDAPQTQFQMRLDLGTVQVNRLDCASQHLWTMPRIEGAPLVDLAHPPRMTPTSVPRSSAPPAALNRRRSVR